MLEEIEHWLPIENNSTSNLLVNPDTTFVLTDTLMQTANKKKDV